MQRKDWDPLEKSKQVHPVRNSIWMTFEGHCWLYTTFLFFFGYAWRLAFVKFNYYQFNPVYFLIYWLIIASTCFSQQVSSPNCVQWLPTKCTTYRVKLKCWTHFTCHYLYIFVCIKNTRALYVSILYTNFIHSSYDVDILKIRIDVCKMHRRYIENVANITTNFCIHLWYKF